MRVATFKHEADNRVMMKIAGNDRFDSMDASSMPPWHVADEQRRLRAIQREREEVCRQLSMLRHQLNHQVCK